MALAIGQHVASGYSNLNSVTTSAITTSTTTNFILITISENGTGAPTITDSKSNTWTQRATVTCPGGYTEEPYHIFTSIGATGGSSHTFTASKSDGFPSIFVVEITGSAAYGEVLSATLTADPKVTAALTAAAGSALVAFSGGEGQTSASWGGSFTGQDSITDSAYWQGSSAARIVSSAGSYTAPCTTGNGTLSAAFLLELTDAGGGGSQTVTASGVASAETFGSATVTPGAVSILPGGIASAEAFGTAALTATYTVTASGIASAESVGNPALTTGSVSVLPGGVASVEAFGGAVVSQGGVFILPSAIDSLEAFGTATLSPGGVFILPAGISTAEAFGVAVASSGAIIAPASIDTLEAFGVASLVPGVVYILPTGIESGEFFGVAQVGDVVVTGEYGIVLAITQRIAQRVTTRISTGSD